MDSLNSSLGRRHDQQQAPRCNRCLFIHLRCGCWWYYRTTRKGLPLPSICTYLRIQKKNGKSQLQVVMLGTSFSRSGGGSTRSNDKVDSTPSIRRSSTGSQQASSVSGTNSNSNICNNNVFRKFLMGHRTNDYHADMAAAHPSVRGASVGVTGDEGGNEPSQRGLSRRSIIASDAGSGTPFWKRLAISCNCISKEQRMDFSRKILRNKFWRVLLIVCSFILLFGAQIRTLAFTKGADTAFDAIFMVTFCIFLFDILMRCDVEPNYFAFNMGGCCRRRVDNSAQGPTADGAANSGGGFQIGSFLFWCEFASTLALLHEITFIHKKNFDETRLNITLDAAGVPVREVCDLHRE